MKKERKLIFLDVIWRKKDKVEFRIGEQSHRWKNFGNNNDGNTVNRDTLFAFQASNGLKLKSVGSPEWRPSENTLYGRGSSEDRDNLALVVTETIFRKIQKAIQEYNETFLYEQSINDNLDKDLFEI